MWRGGGGGGGGGRVVGGWCEGRRKRGKVGELRWFYTQFLQWRQPSDWVECRACHADIEWSQGANFHPSDFAGLRSERLGRRGMALERSGIVLNPTQCVLRLV